MGHKSFAFALSIPACVERNSPTEPLQAFPYNDFRRVKRNVLADRDPSRVTRYWSFLVALEVFREERARPRMTSGSVTATNESFPSREKMVVSVLPSRSFAVINTSCSPRSSSISRETAKCGLVVVTLDPLAISVALRGGEAQFSFHAARRPSAATDGSTWCSGSSTVGCSSCSSSSSISMSSSADGEPRSSLSMAIGKATTDS